MTKKKKLIYVFWKKIILGIFKEKTEFYQSFKKYSLEVPKCFEKNRNFLNNTILLFDCGEENYKNYVGLLNSLKEMGVHNPDYKIILDAHDFARDRFAVFVSSDKKLLDKVMDFNGLNINEYGLLN